MDRNIHCIYVSEKINKIRWRPHPLGDPHSFVTASWDNDVNNIKLWEVQERGIDEEFDFTPYEIKNLPFDGDITELKFVNADHFVVSSSTGSVYLIKITTNETGEIDLVEEIHWKRLHRFRNDPCSCTSFAIYDSDIATVGEDGNIHLLTATSHVTNKIIKDADSCTINCTEFLKYNELITSNMRGLMKIWDLRTNCDKPETMFLIRNDSVVSASCIAYHPTQRHIIAAGDDQGSTTFWDLRQNTYPLNMVKSHHSNVAEVHFHPDKPEHVFSCSDAGEVFHWKGTKPHVQDPWFVSAVGANKCDIFRLIPQLHTPINSIDLNRDRLLCGTDNETMYLIEDINIYN